jgi:23S rRNA pseudouridine2605 synthase
LKTREGQLNAKAAPRRSKAVKTGPARIKLVRDAENPWYEITLIEGRNRQIRRMFKQIGHDVEKIRRVRYGPLELDIEPGKFRHLTAQEVSRLKSATTSTNRSAPARPVTHRPAREKNKNRRP